MRVKWIKNLAIIASVILGLSGCSSGGSCNNCSANVTPPTPPASNLTLTLVAPNAYPAGIAATAYLTITNTSTVNATNLRYSVPLKNESGNSTGVNIDVTNGDTNCPDITAGHSCTFTALIPAGSVPGSFTVTATGDSSSSSLASKIKSVIGIKQVTTLSLTAYIGLVNTPSVITTPLYILPEKQTLNISASATTIMFSVLVANPESGFNQIKFADANGTLLSSTLESQLSPNPTGNYTQNYVATFAVVIPAGTSTTQQIQAFTYNGETPVCNTSGACSNMAQVFFAVAGAGILNVAPSVINMSQAYKSQVITLSNQGSGSLTSVTAPASVAPFTITNNTCTGTLAGKAADGLTSSCSYTLTYAYTGTTGEQSLVFTYNNGLTDSSESVPALYNHFWTLISGGTGQIPNVQEIFGAATPSAILATDGVNNFAWVYNKGVWKQLNDGTNGTPGAGTVKGAPTTTSFIFSENVNFGSNSNLWKYVNGTWTQLTQWDNETLTQPGQVYSMGENATPDSMVITADGTGVDQNVWIYKNNVWTKLSGGNGPQFVAMLSKFAPVESAIVVYESSGPIWTYNGNVWNKVGDNITPPNPQAYAQSDPFYGFSTPNSIIFAETTNSSDYNLWTYSNSSWTAQSGSGNQPGFVSTIFGSPTTSSMVIRDNADNSIWTYSNSVWTNTTTGNGSAAPASGQFVFGSNATPELFFMTDNDNPSHIWKYSGSTWINLTNGDGVTAPMSGGTMLGQPLPTFLLLGDQADGGSQLWSYVDGIWTVITGKEGEPSGSGNGSKASNPYSIVMSANPPPPTEEGRANPAKAGGRVRPMGGGSLDLWIGQAANAPIN